MKPIVPIRILITAVASLATALVLIMLLVLTDTALSVWQRMQDTPVWFLIGWPLFIVAVAALVGWKAWRFLSPAKPTSRQRRQAQVPLDEPTLQKRLQTRQTQGVDTADAARELQELDRRRAAGVVHVALFGEISSGKSSLIKALLPGLEVETGPLGGTTREVTHYSWTSSKGDRLVLSDMPGLNEADGDLDKDARAEATRAHAIIYVCEGDLTRTQLAELQQLLTFDKPMIGAINKIDLLNEQDLQAIASRLRERLGEDVPIVTVTAGALREVTLEHPDGSVESGTRALPAAVEPLRQALQDVLDRDPEVLDQLRDAAVFDLAANHLDTATREFRRRESELIVRSHARKAMLGSLAAVGPGTDVLVQGYLGMSMMKALAGLYGLSPKEMDLNRFMELATRHVDHRLNILLAISGNVLKAFPGVGTVTGGLAHAVAYGLIFDSLGRAAAKALDSRGNLAPDLTLKIFEDTLGENLESRAKRLAGLVLSKKEDDPG